MSSAALLSVCLFGSAARGDSDALSDIDVLAIVRNHAGKVPESEVKKYLPDCCGDPTISWYGINRLKAMFDGGELFAWHLYFESKVLFEVIDTSSILGIPQKYSRASEDIAAFFETLKRVPDQLRSAPYNAVYEFGIMYVCVRNVAMSASWYLRQRPDFSRMSPFKLGNSVPPCPLSTDEYERSMACRMASQRGLPLLDGISASSVLTYHEKVLPWIGAVAEVIREEQYGKSTIANSLSCSN